MEAGFPFSDKVDTFMPFRAIGNESGYDCCVAHVLLLPPLPPIRMSEYKLYRIFEKNP
jgi:hypothetical protein